MKIESFPRKLFLFRNNLCMFAQTQNELHNMKHMSILAVSLLALVACTPEKKQEADYGSPDKPGGLSIQLCKSEKKEFYIRYSS